MDFIHSKVKKLASSPYGDVFEGVAYNFYEIKEPPFSKQELEYAAFFIKLIQRSSSTSMASQFVQITPELVNEFREEVVSLVEMNGLLKAFPSNELFTSIAQMVEKVIKPLSAIADKNAFARYVVHNAIGLKQLSFFSLDDDLEELMINTPNAIFVFHKVHGMCKTNVVIDEGSFNAMMEKVVFTLGKSFGSQDPLLDARLPDGSRVNATARDVSPHGFSLTIRKFSPIPLTILDLIKNRTISSEVAGFLWTVIDGFGTDAQNILLTGSTASGKTTLLNVMINFVRLNERIISIEDTLELSMMGRENWVALESKRIEGKEIGMNDLLKNALRMRPDRIIVGEVRAEEAITLFTAMDNGHNGCMGTIHANDAREAVIKLQEKPLEVPAAMIPLVDLILVLRRTYVRGEGIHRRVVQVAEVSRMESKVLLGDVYVYDEQSERLKRTDVPSHVIEMLALRSGVSKIDIKKEIETRSAILEWMIARQIKEPLDVLEVIQSYYYDPEKVLATIYSSMK